MAGKGPVGTIFVSVVSIVVDEELSSESRICVRVVVSIRSVAGLGPGPAAVMVSLDIMPVDAGSFCEVLMDAFWMSVADWKESASEESSRSVESPSSLGFSATAADVKERRLSLLYTVLTFDLDDEFLRSLEDCESASDFSRLCVSFFQNGTAFSLLPLDEFGRSVVSSIVLVRLGSGVVSSFVTADWVMGVGIV